MKLSFLNKTITTLETLRNRTAWAIEELTYRRYQHLFGHRPDDIYIATFMKSGTTWMQMILYQILTDGNMDFKHIYDVSPCLRDLAHARADIPFNLSSPRIIKTHDPYHRIPRTGRYIFVIRNGMDVANSWWHHQRNYHNPKLTFQEVFNKHYAQPRHMNWFTFNRAWLQNKYHLPILYIRYEDLKTDFDQQLIRIENFLGVYLSTQKFNLVKERSSFEFMKAHEQKFGMQPVETPQTIYNQFIRHGQPGEGQEQMTDENFKVWEDGIRKMESALSLEQALLIDQYF